MTTNSALIIICRCAAGVEPMTKNEAAKSVAAKSIAVVDEFGNDYGTTYPKRARGLVKNGRARFVDENKICLTRPPNNENSEVKTVNNDLINSLKEDETLRKQLLEDYGISLDNPEDLNALANAFSDGEYELVSTREETRKKADGNSHNTAGFDPNPKLTKLQRDSWRANLRAAFSAWSQSYTNTYLMPAYPPITATNTTSTVIWAANQPNYAMLFNNHVAVELLLNPNNPLHEELSKAMADAIEKPPVPGSDYSFGQATQKTFEIIRIVKQVLNEE